MNALPESAREHGYCRAVFFKVQNPDGEQHHLIGLFPYPCTSVLIEHLIWSAALAIPVGMIYSRFTGRDPSWIIIAVAFVPDMDFVLEWTRAELWTTIPVTVSHGDFHNILFLMDFSLLAAAALTLFHIRFSDAFFCTAAGIAAHIVEDALVYEHAYAFFWPYSTKILGIGIMEETRNLAGIASSTVLAVGVILLTVSIFVRTCVEGTGWWSVFLRGGRTGRELP
jgi:hypothetical protein